ncbi:MAG: 4Fe-4S dicluster domain-containing protein [Bacteroidota bacterium]
MRSNGKEKYCLTTEDLAILFKELKHQGFLNVGPVFRDGVVMLDHLGDFTQIAKGYYDEQNKGQYRIEQKDDNSFFQYTLGPQSFKKFLHPPKRKLWEADGSQENFKISVREDPSKMAFWGIRSCDLSAIKILDKVFLEGPFINEWYKKAREQLFIISAACTRPSDNCFCTSMGTGPVPKDDFDISLVEVLNHSGHYFLADFKSDKASTFINVLDFKRAGQVEIQYAEEHIEKAIDSMPFRFDPSQAATTIKANLEHRHWEEVAEKCLSCANCTMVCPTCFCTSTEDITDLSGDHSERWLRWDSCFNGEFSFIHGGRVRNSTKSRYRQWMSHKLSSWYDQFGTSGCVGCGRCITWCPVGIDITEELKAIEN